MILTCPACATRYFVADGVVGASGKAVRCASCQHRWMAYPDTDSESEFELKATVEPASFAAEPEAAPEPEPEKPAANAAPRAFREKAQAKKTVHAAMVNGMVWAGIAAGFALLIGTSVIFRVDIVRAAPRTASAFAAVGLPVNPTGLAFEGVAVKPGLQDGHDALVVSGAMRNIEKHAVTTPILAVRLLDKAGHLLGVRRVDAGEAQVPAGGSHTFVLSLLDPPEGVHDVELAFGGLRKAAKGHESHEAAPHGEAHGAQDAHNTHADPGLRGPAHESLEEAGPVEVPTTPTPIMDLPAASHGAAPAAETHPHAAPHGEHG